MQKFTHVWTVQATIIIIIQNMQCGVTKSTLFLLLKSFPDTLDSGHGGDGCFR